MALNLPRKEKLTRIVKNVIKKYDGIFDPTRDRDARAMAEHIIHSLMNSGVMPLYEKEREELNDAMAGKEAKDENGKI
jgi:hypothetical protein